MIVIFAKKIGGYQSLTILEKVPYAPFLYPMKTLENCKDVTESVHWEQMG